MRYINELFLILSDISTNVKQNRRLAGQFTRRPFAHHGQQAGRRREERDGQATFKLPWPLSDLVQILRRRYKKA